MCLSSRSLALLNQETGGSPVVVSTYGLGSESAPSARGLDILGNSLAISIASSDK